METFGGLQPMSERQGDTRQNQCARICRLLEQAKGEWVPLPRILDLRIASHTRRIHELRKAGVSVEMHSFWFEGERRTEYRLQPAATPSGDE
jgi:hypothetical protein